MKQLTKVVLLCLLAVPVFSQTQKDPSFQEMQQRMLEMQRQLMQQFQQMDGGAFSMPEFKWDTTYSFQFDTLIGSDGMSGSFFFSPFGQDSSFMQDFWGKDPFSDGFNPFDGGFQWTFPPRSGFPENDENSALEGDDDGLLPEERLRKEENGETMPEKKKAPPAAKKSKIKTIRI